MFLHSGAGMHSHEFNPHRKAVPIIPPLTRSTFSNQLPRRASAYDIPNPVLHRPTAMVRPVSEYTLRPSELVVRFSEPEMDTMSEDGRSVANSEDSEATTTGRRRRRRSTRTSSAFLLAHPAPTLTQKQRLLQIRPKLLLQLQKLSAESRPTPSIDVLPSTVVVPRLVKKFPRMFRGKGELGANDVMVVKSEEYDTSDDHATEDAESDEEGLANRDLMAVICQMRKDSGGSQGKAEIVLSDGSVWVATPLPNGLYEFVTVDERGNKILARWVRRSGSRRSNFDSAPGNEFKFTFSIIDPNSRRHPIMASITNNTLDIPDSYTSVSSSAGKHPPTSPIRGLGESDSQPPVDEPSPERTTHTIDENIKTLIQVTGIWVALRQGLSPYFKYNDVMASTTACSPIQRNVSGPRLRTISATHDSERTSPARNSTGTPESTQTTFGGRIRQKCVKGSPCITASAQFEQVSHPKRSVSTGSAFMQRAAARRAGVFPGRVASDSEGDGTALPLKRAATEQLTGLSDPASTSQFFSSGFSAVPIETPTKSQRRTQSVFIPSNVHPNELVKRHIDSHSVEFDGKETTTLVEKLKPGRWKAFKDFFRRSHGITRSS